MASFANRLLTANFRRSAAGEYVLAQEFGVDRQSGAVHVRACEVRGPCLEYALSHGEKFGIWGGLSERERRRVRKNRTTAA
jgi:Transcription factor WhiB